MQRPFAFALVKLDGADTAMLHVVDANGEALMRTGMRVRARWREERIGAITDIECFELDNPVSRGTPEGGGRESSGQGVAPDGRGGADLEPPEEWCEG